ncbi:MAG: endonuclease III domain-containing protein [Halobacteriota archaeon]
MQFKMRPPIDLERTMTIQIPALEWTRVGHGYRRRANGITQHVRPRVIENAHAETLDLEGVHVDELQWTPLAALPAETDHIRTLRDFYAGIYFMDGQDPFRCLILTILTQNKTAERAREAFDNLVQRFGSITPQILCEADPRDIVPLLRQCGPHRKAAYLVSAARELMCRWEGDMSWVYDAPDHARETLLSLPGVGPKTADCVLLYAGGHDVVPIDTHVERVARRLGFIERAAVHCGLSLDLERMSGTNRSKELAKRGLERELSFPGKSHLLLIQHGFEWCHASCPACTSCPLRHQCTSCDNRCRVDP